MKGKRADSDGVHPMKSIATNGESLKDEMSDQFSESDYSSSGSSDMDDEEIEVPHNDQKKPKKKQIVAEQLRIARETSELFKSNIFKMQIDELVKEIAVSEKYQMTANKALYQLRDTLKQSEPSKEVGVREASSLYPNKVPFPTSLDPDSNIKFKYLPPKDVNVVGSYSLKTLVRQPEGSPIDLVVVIPSELFGPKDYLNYRYLQKRAFYVAATANIIANNASKLGVSVRYQRMQNDPLRTGLKLEFTNKKLAKHLFVVVHFGIESDVFSAKKLAASKNCVRSVEGPTPRYNASILTDMAYEPLLVYLHTASAVCPKFTEACKLGRLWLRQRGLQEHFGHFEFAILMASLLNGGPSGKRVLLSGYSSYQLFKGTLLFLSKGEIDLTFAKNEPTRSAESGAVTLELRGLGLNVVRVSPSTFELLKHEAAVTCDLLNDVARDRFADIFLRNTRNPYLRFDLNLSVDVPPEEYDQTLSPNYYDFIVDKVHALLKQGCEQRTKVISVSCEKYLENNEWSLSSAPPKLHEETVTLIIGIILDIASSEKRVTFGPSPTEKAEVAEFKSFWGTKSSLRRFQDGQIKEAVVWKPSAKSVVVEIAQYVLGKHLHAELEIPKTVDLVLPFKRRQHSDRPLTSLALFQAKINAFNECAQMMQGLQDIPLRVNTIYGISSSLRYTSIIEPLPFDTVADDSIAEAIIQLEASSKWPADIAAIEKTKTAFLLKMASEVRKQSPNYDTIVGVEPSIIRGQLETSFLTIQTPTGFYFKFRLATNKDEVLYRESTLSEKTKLQLERLGPHAASHNRLISTMALRYPFYSPTARALKIWFRRHFLASYVTEQAIELLALKPFLESSPYVVPNSISTAFYRILDFLGKWDWREDALVLDTERRTDGSDIELLTQVTGCNMEPTSFQVLTNNFRMERKRDPALTLSPYFIGTKIDPTGILWTQTQPRSRRSLLICSRVTALSRNCSEMIIENAVERMFSPSIGDFDVEFKVDNPSVMDNKGKYRNLTNTNLKAVAMSANNIGQEFFDDIQDAYKDCLILFFNGSIDDKVNKHQSIVGVWSKDAEAPQKYRVNIPYPVKPYEGSDVALNKDAVLEEIKRIGGDIVTLRRY